MQPVYRAPMRSRRDDVDPGLAPERAVALGLCGVGGRLPREPSGLEDAVSLTEEVYDDRTARRLERFAAVPVGAFVWTREGEGLYLLGRLTGAWRYDGHPDALAADLVHVRDCAWSGTPVSEAEVPAAVMQTFSRGGRNFQQIHDPAVAARSQVLWDGAV